MQSIVFELPPDRFSVAWPLFEPVAFDRAYIHAVFEGLDPGRLFVDDAEHPAAALLCRTYDYYLAGESNPALLRFIAEAPAEAEVFAAMYGYVSVAGDRSMPETGFVAAGDALHRDLLAHHQERLEVWGRRSLEFDSQNAGAAKRWREAIPGGFEIVGIDGWLAERIDRELNEVIGLVWGSCERFAARGFGACAVAGDRLASVCFTLGLSREYADLGVATAAVFRRRGLAALVSRACIAEALDRGVTPTWDCDAINEPSAALALSLGFAEGPAFAELAFPDRATPVVSTDLWQPEHRSDGPTRWTRRDGE